jgi:hypothetical protein
MKAVEIDPLEYAQPGEGEENRKSRLADAQRSRLHGWVAATVALLATFLTICQVKDGNIVQAMQQAQASSVDQWNWYQFRKVRSELFQATVDQLRLQALSAPAAVRPAYARQIAAYQRKVNEQEAKMRETQAQAQASDKAYNTLNAHDDQFDLSEASVSLAIALLALTALTNKRWLYGMAMVPTALGLLMGLAGLFNWNLRVDALMKFLS